MSFELLCESCGAASGPSVGICPFCKSVLTNEKSKKAPPALKRLKTLFQEGKIEEAALLARAAIQSNDTLSSHAEVLCVCAQILFEIEAPLSELKGLLAKASLIDPEHQGIQDLLMLVQAKSAVNFGQHVEGKKIIKEILKTDPKNPHALFLFATILNFKEDNPILAMVYLEKALQARPTFLRAWACLAGISAQIGRTHVAERALLKALSLETNPSMRVFFNNLLNRVRNKTERAA